jgi:hypothetical protein
LDDYNKVAVNLEFNKLLVPTPQNPDLDGNGTITPEERRQNLDNYRSIGWVSVYLNHLEMRQAVLAKKVEVTCRSRIFISRLFCNANGLFS